MKLSNIDSTVLRTEAEQAMKSSQDLTMPISIDLQCCARDDLFLQIGLCRTIELRGESVNRSSLQRCLSSSSLKTQAHSSVVEEVLSQWTHFLRSAATLEYENHELCQQNRSDKVRSFPFNEMLQEYLSNNNNNFSCKDN